MERAARAVRRVIARVGARLAAVAAVLVVAASATPAAAQDLGGFTIRSFDTELTIESNSDLVVTERIVVDFSEPRRGIFRTIPVRYSDPRGYAYSLGLRLIGVTDDDGREYETLVRHEGGYVNVRIGDPDRTVTGSVVYVLRYRVRDALSRFGEFDEIYWNATGHEWNVPIGSSSATVRLPANPGRDAVQAAGYTGAFGQAERAVEVTYPEPGVVHFRTTRSLEPREGLTIAVGFPEGVVTFPSMAVLTARRAFDNWILLMPLAWLALLVRRYRRAGRDPDAGAPIVVSYEPPPDITPGGIGTLIDERVDTVDVTATVVDLAVRRYLTIRTERRDRLFGLLEHEETVFVREPADGRPPLAPHEALVMAALFEKGDEVPESELTNEFYRHIPGIRNALYARLVEKGHFDGSPEKVRNRWIALGVAAAAVTGIVGYVTMAWRGIGPPAVPVVPIAAAAITFGLFSSFSRAMPRKTKRGAAALRWALGFQEFARRVEGERLAEAAGDPRYEFEALLPYAMALGVAGEWARKYEGIYDRDPPAWYVGHHDGTRFSTMSFERSLSSAMARTARTMTSSPRSSSGSGGGGSSGGGGGGGGGGSW